METRATLSEFLLRDNAGLHHAKLIKNLPADLNPFSPRMKKKLNDKMYSGSLFRIAYQSQISSCKTFQAPGIPLSGWEYMARWYFLVEHIIPLVFYAAERITKLLSGWEYISQLYFLVQHGKHCPIGILYNWMYIFHEITYCIT